MVTIEHINPHNLIDILALVGLALSDHHARPYFEPPSFAARLTQRPDSHRVVDVAAHTADILADWPADMSEPGAIDWWRARIDETASNLEATLLSGVGWLDGAGVWHHTPWRLIGGRQKWISMIRRSASDVTEAALEKWLDDPAYRYSRVMPMTGLDAYSYRSHALVGRRLTDDEARALGGTRDYGSRGNPVTLWLATFAALHMPPASGTSLAPGWHEMENSELTVRWPIWTRPSSAQQIMGLWSLVGHDLDAGPDGEDASTRHALEQYGVPVVLEGQILLDLDGFYERISPGMHV